MERDRVLEWTRAQRLSFAELLDGLQPDDWEVASLCSAWSVREVAAHLTLSTRTTWRAVVPRAVRARGNFDRMEAAWASERARQFPAAELIAQIRETAGSARRAPLAGLLDPLVDVLVHGQDIARPLGIVRPMPVEPAVAALGQVLASPFYGARKRLAGLHLEATDAAWSSGQGPSRVRGGVADLLLVATGRVAGLGGLTGPGAEFLSARMAAAV